MVSKSSKILPFASLAIAFFSVLAAMFGYAEQVERVSGLLLAILPITGGGGIVVKAIEGSVEKRKALEASGLKEVIKTAIEESKK